ncbi:MULTISPECIES: 2-hydroxyacid dehydrogenase [Clostridium]|uniref:Hydroxyacid dehydrogenase n=1 Tax=Clostridium butyricum TaxID=1492 RepID=A0AAP9UG54_CLOBU|nr:MULTISPECIES: 2-hydroxyacid dehydrogenase [Clostridium]AXB86811.1 hydroxyacid dehydrogenase [Clostridium butyricum]KIU04660.1 glycerate dehydrogenase [Clostridium butyricum]MBA8968656.1 D-3-phosphoglycerate dehydrogenase [Clostridium butyricum]MBA8973488.1 D-3-phosphoglycerate dehydrogenase [Clostridium butyricum]MBC2426107.1 hydroxyacid dehydrogenase [Clostridium butyricum]
MKLSILEPLGVEKEKFLDMAEKVLGDRVEITYYDNRVEDSETLIERSKDAEIVVLSNFQYRKDVIEKCPNLKMICVAFTGVDHVDIDYCKDRGITVCNCAGYSTVAVADLVFGLLINIYRNIVECNIVTRKGGTKNGLVGFELEGKKFGVIGTGAIGMRVANIAKAFGCEVYAYSRTVKEGKEIKYVDLNTLLSTCDVISLHVPLNENTKGLINEENIKLMKKNAILINTARGPVVDSKALSDALKNNIIAGAGIDVFEIEPPIPVDHVLFDAPNLIVTPHVAFATKESMVKRAEIVFDNIDKYINGSSQNVIV